MTRRLPQNLTQPYESHLAIERETALVHCKEMAMNCKENRIQCQMMSMMLMAMMQKNSGATLSGMIGNITCIGASMGGDPAPPAGQGGEDKNGGEVGELAIARRAN